MSKNKNKDKKNENLTGIESLVQQQKRQLLQQTFTIKKLQDRLSRITEQHHEITNTRQQFQKNYEQKIDKQRIIIETHQNTIKELRNKVYDLQIKKMNLQGRIRDLQRQLKQIDQSRQREMDQYKKLTQNELNKLEAQLKEYNFYMNERDQLQKDRSNIRKLLEEEKSEKVRQIADKQRQKVQATDKLRDEMLHKVRDMRSNLLSLKKQQLSTTTRLAVLQNHQLTSQLEFQSKQTQKLLFENQDMHKKLSNLQKDLQVHKQVEQQLAKRSHYSRGIIKKLTTKINQLQGELEILKTQQNKNERKGSAKQKEENKKQNIIMSLDKSLQNTQKKYLRMQADYDVVRNQNEYLKTKLTVYEKRGQDLVSLLHGYYQDVIGGSLQVRDQKYSYDLSAMKKRPIQQWNKQQIKMVVLVLLNQIAPKITRKNLGIPNINKSSLYLASEEDQLIKLPKLSDNSIMKKLQNKNKMQDLPTNIASKIVGSNLREWGRTVHANSVSHLSRKYRIYDK